MQCAMRESVASRRDAFRRGVAEIVSASGTGATPSSRTGRSGRERTVASVEPFGDRLRIIFGALRLTAGLRQYNGFGLNGRRAPQRRPPRSFLRPARRRRHECFNDVRRRAIGDDDERTLHGSGKSLQVQRKLMPKCCQCHVNAASNRRLAQPSCCIGRRVGRGAASRGGKAAPTRGLAPAASSAAFMASVSPAVPMSRWPKSDQRPATASPRDRYGGPHPPAQGWQNDNRRRPLRRAVRRGVQPPRCREGSRIAERYRPFRHARS